ncbi:hypothetical protein HHA33_05820 [Phytobacter diazotrophicus]|uniref:hypothetical protein n=1 Tax=Phytobacter diazotrophicus TaxID=395631 RepID=UPI00145279BC|nr:hypothetical protein [Phytobacter diazotrophicus]QJF16088.1 hypothetical protein HHA33_05820 [Phytobacter diazotrophicus]
MKNNAFCLLVFLSFTSYSKSPSEQQLSRMISSAECLGYMTLFNDDDQTASVAKVRQLVDVFKDSSKSVLQYPDMRDILAKGIFAKSGVKFSDEFYAGSILAASREEVTNSIKENLGGKQIEPNGDLKKIWGFEARRRFDASNCNQIK